MSKDCGPKPTQFLDDRDGKTHRGMSGMRQKESVGSLFQQKKVIHPGLVGQTFGYHDLGFPLYWDVGSPFS